MTLTSENITQHTAVGQRLRGLEMPWHRVRNTDMAAGNTAGGHNSWSPQEFLAECIETLDETPEMKTFVFRRVDGTALAFRAGQYLNIDFPVFGADHEPVSRSYSLSSAPTSPWTFAITVKRDPEGLVSPWVHEHVHPGTVLDMLGPVGTFHLPDADRRARYLLLAAGAGITPIMSMIRTIGALPGQADAIVLYHASEPESFAFRQELDYLAATDARLKIHYCLGDRGSPGSWAGMSGRLSATMLDEIAPDANGRQVYVCGPAGYLQQAQVLLDQLSVDASSIHVEYFVAEQQTQQRYRKETSFASALAPQLHPDTTQWSEHRSSDSGPHIVEHEIAEATPGAQTPTEPLQYISEVQPGANDLASFETVGTGQFMMSFTRSGKNVRIDAGEKVLDAAREAGIEIPMNCRQGMCGSCKTTKVDGEVDMRHQGGIRAREIEAGKFLPCCSTPCSDLIIEA